MAEGKIERYCATDSCPGGDGCINKHRRPGQPCLSEYVAAPEGDPREKFNWLGDGPPPPRWETADGTIVYRSYSDSID